MLKRSVFLTHVLDPITDNFQATSSQQEVLFDAIGWMDVFVNDELEFITQDSRLEESDIELLAVNGAISFQVRVIVLFLA